MLNFSMYESSAATKKYTMVGQTSVWGEKYNKINNNSENFRGRGLHPCHPLVAGLHEAGLNICVFYPDPSEGWEPSISK